MTASTGAHALQCLRYRFGRGASLDDRFNAADWKRLSAIDRAHRCRFMAEQAMMLAESAAPELSTRYLEVAESFLKLALDLEAKAKISRG